MPTEQEKADLSKKRGQAAAQITDPDTKRQFIAAQGEAERKGKGTASPDAYERLNKEADDTMATGGMNKSVGVPSYKKGTPYVPQTGMAKLHKGEAVIPAEVNPYGKIAPGKPKKSIKSIHVTATDNGKHVVTHKHHHPSHPDEIHAMNSVEDLTKHMSDNASKIAAQPPSDNDGDEGGAAPAMPGM